MDDKSLRKVGQIRGSVAKKDFGTSPYPPWCLSVEEDLLVTRTHTTSFSFYHQNGYIPPLRPAPFSCWKYDINTFIAQQGGYI